MILISFFSAIKGIKIQEEEKINSIREQIFKIKQDAEKELNIAKSIKNKVDDSVNKNILLTEAIKMIENEKDSNTAIGQFKAAEKEFQTETNETLLEQTYTLLQNSLQNYKKSITNIKKYKALVHREIAKKEFAEINRMIDKTNDFFYDTEKAINLKKEINNEIGNKTQENTIIYLLEKSESTLKAVNNIVEESNNNMHNRENTNNQYEYVIHYCQDISEKCQKLKIKLKNFFIEIFRKDTAEKKQMSNNNDDKIITLFNEQKKIKKWQIIILIFNLIFYILIYIFLKKKNKNNFCQKIENKKFLLKKSL